MRSTILRLAAPFALLSLFACAPSTRLTDVWRNPEVKGPIQFKKVLVAVLASNPNVRKTAEGKLCLLMKRTEAVPSWMAVSQETAGDREKTEAMLKREGFDGAVVLRLVGASYTETWVSTSMGGGFLPYWNYAYPAIMAPDYLKKDSKYRVETRIYDLKADRLVWAGYSDTVNPDSGDKMLNDLAQAVGEELKADGLIQ